MTHRLKRLDGLRGIAILLVIFGHEADFTLGLHVAGEVGAVGVLLFFILSGFLITGLLQQELAETGRIDRAEFYRRRAFRILPAFWALIAVTVVLMLAGLVTDVTWKAVLTCLLFVRNIRGRGQSLGHTWSLSLQEQFYLIWPAIIVKFGLKRAFTVAACLVVAGTLWRTYAIATRMWAYETDVFYLRTDFRLDSILCGCLVALALADERMAPALRRIFQAVPLSVCIPLLLAWALAASEVVALRPVFLTVETVLAVLVFGKFVVAAPSAMTVRTCEHPAMVWVGMMSYSLYLWQQLFAVTREPSWGPIRELPLNLLCILGAALLSNHLIERPALRLRKRWSRAREHAAAPVHA